jgi:hypothetical protein
MVQPSVCTFYSWIIKLDTPETMKPNQQIAVEEPFITSSDVRIISSM